MSQILFGTNPAESASLSLTQRFSRTGCSYYAIWMLAIGTKNTKVIVCFFIKRLWLKIKKKISHEIKNNIIDKLHFVVLTPITKDLNCILWCIMFVASPSINSVGSICGEVTHKAYASVSYSISLLILIYISRLVVLGSKLGLPRCKVNFLRIWVGYV